MFSSKYKENTKFYVEASSDLKICVHRVVKDNMYCNYKAINIINTREIRRCFVWRHIWPVNLKIKIKI